MAQQTITRAYDSYTDATSAVTALEQAGIPHSDISLVGRDSGASQTGMGQTGMGQTGTGTANTAAPAETEAGAGTGASIGTIIGGGAGLLAGIGSLAIPGVGPVVAAGWLIATLTGAGVGAAVGGGTGGLVGMLTGAGVSHDDAHLYAETVRRGGNVVSVRVDETQAAMVESVLDRHTAIDPMARRAEYQGAGWSRHDETGAPYSPTTTSSGLPPRADVP